MLILCNVGRESAKYLSPRVIQGSSKMYTIVLSLKILFFFYTQLSSSPLIDFPKWGHNKYVKRGFN